jgi:protein-disulfide isomerase
MLSMNKGSDMKHSTLFLALMSTILFSAAAAQNAAQITTVAEVDGKRISLEDLNEASGEQLARLEEQAYQLKHDKLGQMIDDRLLEREAQRRNVSLKTLIDTEITAKAAEVTSEEIHSVYELNKNQLLKPEAEVAEQLRSLLREQKIATRRHEFARSLQAKAKVTIYLEPPVPFRAHVGVDGPSRGSPDALVTIVEFEDFQCPFCKKAQETVQNVLAHYKDKVRLVHRDFPLQPLHPASLKAHEAARCAEEQGKFWEYRELLYKNAPAGNPDQLTQYASQLALNLADFNSCLASEKFRAVVQNDEDEGDRLGVQGTPAFFINGRLLSGAQPDAEFSRMIDEELNQRAQR